jgi:hypothetical protein
MLGVLNRGGKSTRSRPAGHLSSRSASAALAMPLLSSRALTLLGLPKTSTTRLIPAGLSFHPRRTSRGALRRPVASLTRQTQES